MQLSLATFFPPQVLQRMGYLNRDQSVTMKGRVACEINSGAGSALFLQLFPFESACWDGGGGCLRNQLRCALAGLRWRPRFRLLHAHRLSTCALPAGDELLATELIFGACSSCLMSLF